MICPQCKADGVRSQTFLQNAVKTMNNYQPFRDESGKLHWHDANTMTSVYRCSRSHRFEVQESGKCWCGWKGLTDE